MTTNPPDKILDRVRKLLRLADNAGSEAEAATAAARAAALMAEHAITEAQAALDAGDDAAPEPIQYEALLDPDADRRMSAKRVAWRCTLAHAVAYSVGVRSYYSSGHVVGLGRETAVQTWRYTTSYLAAEVERLADAAYVGKSDYVSARSWKNAFRLGCAERIGQRLRDQARAEQLQRAAQVEVAKAEIEVAQTAGDTSAPPSNHALAVVKVDTAREEVDAAYRQISARFGCAKPMGQTSSYGGLQAGRAAGDRVSLGGTARGLPAGRGRLK
jgi:hypothetical protein